MQDAVDVRGWVGWHRTGGVEEVGAPSCLNDVCVVFHDHQLRVGFAQDFGAAARVVVRSVALHFVYDEL